MEISWDLASRIGLVEESSISFSSLTTSSVSALQVNASQFTDAKTARVAAATNSSPKPIRAPSLLIKAYALALKSKLTSDPSLSEVDQAVYVAWPPEKGVPLDVADEYTNEMIYRHANAIQRDNAISFTHEGDFFQYLSNFIVREESKEIAGPQRLDQKQYIAARNKADEEFKKLLESFRVKLSLDPLYQFRKHLDEEGDAYKLAWSVRDELASRLEPTDLVRAMQILDSAQARADPLRGQTMPSTFNQVGGLDSNRHQILPGMVSCRPLHALSGFKDAFAKWREEYPKRIIQPAEIELDLLGAFDADWADLGFPAFDDATPSVLRHELEGLVSAGLRLTLTYTHVASCGVIRGLWNIEDFREVLAQPLKGNESRYKNKVNKTIRFLLAYGVQIRVQGPSQSLSMIGTTLLGGMSLARVSDTERRTDEPDNDAYPVLLGVLAKKC